MSNSIPLDELEPTFIKIVDDKSIKLVDSLTDAQGIMFLCPRCKRDNVTGVHQVMVWFADRGVPNNKSPGPYRGKIVKGSSIYDLTLEPSIVISCWHGFVTDGHCSIL